MIDDLLDDIRKRLGDRVGGVLYSSVDAFSQPSEVYLLGLNPGENRFAPETTTVAAQIEAASVRAGPWSDYVDGVWTSSIPGGSPMQVRVRHLLGRAGLDPRAVPASNVAFVRSRDASGIASEQADLLARCWSFHSAVIDRLAVKVVVCMGAHAGRWVRRQLGAGHLVAEHVEDNLRRWRSTTRSDGSGRHVVTLTHPSRVDWCARESDPSKLLVDGLRSSRAAGASGCR